jgi:RNA recognition motif-containing protein
LNIVATHRGDVRGAEPVNPGNNLHVSGLSLRVEERDLEEIFSKHGRVRSHPRASERPKSSAARLTRDSSP